MLLNYALPQIPYRGKQTVSGFHASFRIERFTITEITRLLSDKTLPLKEIAERMKFASVSYFCRYVIRILKVTPSEYRNNRLGE